MKVHINSETIYKIEKYIKPELVYIPLENKNGIKYKHLVKSGDYIHKGEVLAVNEEINFPIHSSVSGYALIGSTKTINNGKEIKCVVIENDFKEKYEKSKVITKKNYTKEEFINSLRENGITGLGGSDFPTFLKYKNNNIKYLIVNGVECEPFVSCDKALVKESSEEILEAVDKIMEIFNIKKSYIVLKKNSFKAISAINKYIGTYPNISLTLTEDIYPNGWERLVVKNTLGIEYDKYPTEKGILVNNVSTIYAIYEMLKYNRPLTERIITITGHGIKKKTNVKVKIGTLASEVISSLDGYKKIKNPLFIAGGPMMGKSVPTDDLIITKDLNAILVIENNFEKSLPCISCGKCLEVCPAKIYPALIMKNINNTKKIACLKPEECIECGLCSYICPSKIEVREFVKSAKERLNNNERV